MATTGVVGQRWRADVTPVGAIVPWDGSAAVEWHVAADDRWHDTRTDTGIRHRRVDGVAVFETKVRVPGGDAVQHVWSVADHGGLTVVEIGNESPLPIAVAFTRPDLLTGRPPTDVPIQGIDLPPGSIVVPVGHRASVTVALAHRGPSGGHLPDRVASAAAVARGWIGRVDTASRLELADPSAVEVVRAARCELVLCGPADAGDDPVQFLLGAAELVRMAEWDERDAVAVVPDVAAAVERAAVDPSPLAGAALRAAGVVLATAGERRALADLGRILGRRDGRVGPVPDEEGVAAIAALEGRLATGGRLFPDGIPPAWRGVDVEAHGLVVGPASRLSLALRWHGANVAALWEVTGDPVELTTDITTEPWHTAAPSGDALWVLRE